MQSASCGFALRSWDIGDAYESIALVGARNDAMVVQLRQALAQTGVPLRGTAADAALIVEVLDARDELRAASISGGARTAEYELSLGLRYAIKTADGGYLARPAWASARRIYRIDRGNLVGSSEEQALLRRELSADLVQQVMRAVSAVTRNAAPTS